MPDQITVIADRILDMNPDPIPKLRLLRDVLMLNVEEKPYLEAREEAMQSRLVREVSSQQQKDGSWGRFFSRNRVVKNPCKTTETALIRARALGMDRKLATMQQAVAYLERILKDEVSWPDRLSSDMKHPIAIKMVTAARLREIQPDHPLALNVAAKLIDLLNAAFAPGFYDKTLFMEASEDLLGIRIPYQCPLCFSIYPLLLLKDLMPSDLEQRLIYHLTHVTRGIHLQTNRSLQHLPLEFPSLESMRFLGAMELLSWYPSAVDDLQKAVDWLWEQVSTDGFWDFGSFGRDGLELPLSDNWRTGRRREIDSTVRMLSILVRYQQTCSLRDAVCHPI